MTSNDRPHIALLFEFPTLNGGERSMLSCLQCLADDFQFTAIAPPTGLLAKALKKLSIPVVGFEKSDGLGRLQAIVAELQAELLHANSLSMSRLTGQLAQETSIRTSGHLRDIIRLKKKVISDLNANHRLVAVSQATATFHCEQGLNQADCEVIHNGVDTSDFCLRDRTAIRSLCLPEIGEDQFVVLSVGQICLRKRQRDLARLVSQLPEPTHLVIAGVRHSTKPESIQYEQEIAAAFQNAERQPYLHLLGFREDIPQLMNASNVLVHLAHQEPFGRTLLEAAASELPIIATDVGGTSEMLKHKQHATLVSAEHMEEAAVALQHLQQNPDHAATMACHACERICRHFNVQQAAENLGRFWRSLL